MHNIVNTHLFYSRFLLLTAREIHLLQNNRHAYIYLVYINLDCYSRRKATINYEHRLFMSHGTRAMQHPSTDTGGDGAEACVPEKDRPLWIVAQTALSRVLYRFVDRRGACSAGP